MSENNTREIECYAKLVSAADPKYPIRIKAIKRVTKEEFPAPYVPVYKDEDDENKYADIVVGCIGYEDYVDENVYLPNHKVGGYRGQYYAYLGNRLKTPIIFEVKDGKYKLTIGTKENYMVRYRISVNGNFTEWSSYFDSPYVCEYTSFNGVYNEGEEGNIIIVEAMDYISIYDKKVSSNTFKVAFERKGIYIKDKNKEVLSTQFVGSPKIVMTTLTAGQLGDIQEFYVSNQSGKASNLRIKTIQGNKKVEEDNKLADFAKIPKDRRLPDGATVKLGFGMDFSKYTDKLDISVEDKEEKRILLKIDTLTGPGGDCIFGLIMEEIING